MKFLRIKASARSFRIEQSDISSSFARQNLLLSIFCSGKMLYCFPIFSESKFFCNAFVSQQNLHTGPSVALSLEKWNYVKETLSSYSAIKNVDLVSHLLTKERSDYSILQNLWPMRDKSVVTTKDLIAIIQACTLKQIYDFQFFREISEMLLATVEGASLKDILDICDLYSHLGFLHEPLFSMIINLLQSHTLTDPEQFLSIIRAIAVQRLPNKNAPFFLQHLRESSSNLPQNVAVELFYWYAYLNQVNHTVMLVLLPRILPEIEKLGLMHMAILTHSFFLANVENTYMDNIKVLLQRMASEICRFDENFWRKNKSMRYLHWTLLMIRNCFRYLYPQEYHSLPGSCRNAFRAIKNIEICPTFSSPRKFVTTVSWFLEKLRVSHSCNVLRGPFLHDILERDHSVIWNLNSYKRYYVGTLDKIASETLKDRVLEVMGFRIVQCPYWQWSKMKVKRTCFEYIRMSRYYALRDRRRFDDNFEGWTLPHIHNMDSEAKNVHHDGFFPNYVSIADMTY